jgi:plasmid stabilization system protein ParE
VAEVRLTERAVEKLDRMIVTHSLPPDTRGRLRRSIRVLEQFPLAGRQLNGRWRSHRCLLGPWRWLLIVYIFDERADVVNVVTIQDARTALSATSDV